MKTKAKFMKQLFSILLSLVMVVGMLPMTAYAVVSGEGWYINDENILVVEEKLTELPQYGYYEIIVLSTGELALSDSTVWKYEVTNEGAISGGTFQGEIFNYGTISGGTFQGAVENRNTISGGMFYSAVENIVMGKISGGEFRSTVENVGSISDGTFRGEVKNEYNGFINGGTFIHFITNNHIITGGTFQGMVTNNGYISGGRFENGVGNSNLGTIDGGEFTFTIGNQGVIVKAKLLTTAVSGNSPQSVIHKVNGEDKPLVYGNNILDELGNAKEGKVWYVGDECVESGKVPLAYTEYTLKAHSHDYIYTVNGNTLTETCANGCHHIAKATLTTPQESYTYTGECIMPAVLQFDENWQGSKGNGYTYLNNEDVGIATVTSNPAGKEISTTFEIKAANISSSTVTFNSSNSTYDGDEHKPSVSVSWNNKILKENTDYTLSWDKSGFINADTYTVTVTGKGNFEGIATKTFGIEPKEIGFSWGATQFMVYTGQLVLPEVSATGLASGDTCEVIVSLVETTEGAGIKPGQWTAKIVGLSNKNYKLPENSSVPFEVKYTIYANQSAPVVDGIAETIKGKNDGRISGLTTEMEYATEPTNFNSAYTKITDPNMLFAPGTYYVRYAAKDYYYFSPYTKVTIAEGRKLTVTLPSANEQIGYKIEADKLTFSYEDNVRITISSKDDYIRTERFAIYSNGIDVTDRFNFSTNTLTLTSVTDDVVIAIADRSFADITPPDAEIKIENNSWTSFLNNLTFGLFFKETQDITIVATDKGSGVKNIQYYLAERELELDEVRAVTDWVDYNGSFKINPDNKYIVYAKIVDNDGNVKYINSEGIVLDATAPIIKGVENGKTYYTTQKISVTDVSIETVTVNGTPVFDPSDFSIPGDTEAEFVISATDKAGNRTTVTVIMKPIKELAKATENLSHDNVTSDDAPALKDLVAKLDELIADPDTSDDDERETLEQHKVIAESLLKTIDDVANATNTENTEKVKDVTAENVTPEDKTNLEKAKADLEKALEDNKGNYTEEEKKTIEDHIKRIDNALAELNKPVDTNSPQTSDNSHLVFWIALFFISGGTVITLTVVEKKRKKSML